MKVAVVRNRKMDGIVNRFGRPCPETYGRRSVQRVIDALRAGGHEVSFFEGDKRLIAHLERFMPPDPHTGRPGGLVLNMSYGIQGDCRYTHVPAMLEMAGIPYTGSSPLGHALALDKVVAKTLMEHAGLPTPRYRVLNRPDQACDGLRFPLIVKPRHESTSYGLHCVKNREELERAVREVLTRYQQETLAEEYIEGREVCVGLLGNDPLECLPLVELDFRGRDLHALTWADKYHKRPDEPAKICPAPMDDELAGRLRQLAQAVFRACCCRDYARVDIRVDGAGRPFVLEINSMASLGPGGAFVLAARQAGYDFPALIARILDITHLRYFGVRAAAPTCAVPPEAERPPAPQRVVAAPGPDSESLLSRQTVNDRGILPHKVTAFYDKQLRHSDNYEQLKHIVEPCRAELEGPGVWDTSGECDNTKLRGLQHKYLQTALLLVTDQCFAHCRFCFRKRLVGRTSQEVVQDYEEMAEYVKGHPEISDVLLSGGDPFVLETDQLQTIMDHLLPIAHLTSIRFGTRAMVYYPPRFHDKALAGLFKRIKTAGKTPVIVTHVNHHGEVSEEAVREVGRLRRLGVQFFNQTVLLRQVNDQAEILAATFARLQALGVRPYYLFQARPVKGTAHLRVPLRRGVEIVRDVNTRLSGIQKTYRYIMSHFTGKIEILWTGADNRLYLRYHQNGRPDQIGRVFSRPCPADACWLDDLPCLSEVAGGV